MLVINDYSTESFKRHSQLLQAIRWQEKNDSQEKITDSQYWIF